MPTAVRYDEFGGVDVLRVDEVERPVPVPGDGQVLVRVKAAGINPLPGRAGPGRGRRPHAQTGEGLLGGGRRPVRLRRDGVGSGTRRPAQTGRDLRHLRSRRGVGSLAVRLARGTGAAVIGLVSKTNHEWLKSHGAIPVAYGDGVADRIRGAAPSGVDAFIDTYGDGYVELVLVLGVAAERIDTIVDFAAAGKHGVKTDGGTAAGPGATVLADGHLEVPIANVYPLAQVREAYTELERRHTHGKIVLRP